MKDRSSLSMLETVFFVMIVVTNVMPHARAIDATHAHSAALFRLIVTVVGVIGLLTVWVLKRRIPAEIVSRLPPVGPPAGLLRGDAARPRLSVTYSGTRSDHWRCNLCLLRRSPASLFSLLFMPFLFCLGIGQSLAHKPVWIALGVFLLAVFVWTAFFCGLLWWQIVQRLPRPDSVRTCITTLSAEGVTDQTPDKTALIPWSTVRSIREHEGDLYFLRGMGAGQFIPRRAFRDAGEMQEYLQTALLLWRSRGVAWPQPEPNAGVWPPPPAAAPPSQAAQSEGASRG